MTAEPLPLYYLGDSHIRYLKKAAKIGILAPHEVSGVEVGGATAVGMRNPNAKTNALGRYREWITDKPREAIVVFHLGEVDCGYVIWYRAEKYDEPVEVQMMHSVEAYFEFIDELRDMGFHRIIITGATLPTITDDDQIGEVVIKRSAITATQKQRTELTLRYNEELRGRAEQRGLPYIDIAADVLDPQTGVVDDRLRHPNPENHHMNGNLAAPFWARRLHAAIAQYQAPVQNPREWTCTHATFLKAYPGHSKNMPGDMRQPVAPGDVVSGDDIQRTGQHTVLRNARINGESFPLLTLLHTQHFSSATPITNTVEHRSRLLRSLQGILHRDRRDR